ncbi:hypothetical protein ACS0TY_003357 [Phlomoides rotata]
MVDDRKYFIRIKEVSEVCENHFEDWPIGEALASDEELCDWWQSDDEESERLELEKIEEIEPGMTVGNKKVPLTNSVQQIPISGDNGNDENELMTGMDNIITNISAREIITVDAAPEDHTHERENGSDGQAQSVGDLIVEALIHPTSNSGGLSKSKECQFQLVNVLQSQQPTEIGSPTINLEDSFMDTANSSSGDEVGTCCLANDFDPSVSELVMAEKSPMQWKKAATKRKGKKAESNSCCDETRWEFYRKEKEIAEEVIKAWEVGRKLGLYSKCSDEDIRRQLEIMERRDRAKGNRNNRKERRDPRKICVVGDFNSIRETNERVGRGAEVNHRDISLFDDFISSSGLFDLPLRGRRYTWYRSDGTCKSKLDRMMVNTEWLKWRPDVMLKGLGRSVSDHCPLIMVQSITDWGLKPFKFFNSWFAHPEFRNLCISEWESYHVPGWKSYSLSMKLKRDEEIIQRNRTTAELRRHMIWRESFLFQKVKAKWIKEGDVNSSFFHG